MQTPREVFLRHVEEPHADATLAELRANVSRLKLEALERVTARAEGDGHDVERIMPGVYEQLVLSEIQMTAHVGLGVGIALAVYDEHQSGGSLSRFSRAIREQMTEMGVNMKKRHASRLAKMVAEVEAQRLALRHSHEFMSWLAFRRDDPKYPPDDRLERLKAFRIDVRMGQSRDVLIRVLGGRLAAAVEAADRFLLANRWRLAHQPEHTIETFVWPLLSYQPLSAVRVEHSRWSYDRLVESGAPPMRLEQARQEVAALLKVQLADALDDLPAAAQTVV